MTTKYNKLFIKWSVYILVDKLNFETLSETDPLLKIIFKIIKI
jgi:hypothetical protein